MVFYHSHFIFSVINELDGLAKGSKDGQYSTPQHANKVRKTAEESVSFLEAEFDKKNSHLKTQTSKGNVLDTISFRSEESGNGTVRSLFYLMTSKSLCSV